MEEDIFERALRFLYERRLEQLGIQADIVITKIDDSPNEREKECEGLQPPALAFNHSV